MSDSSSIYQTETDSRPREARVTRWNGTPATRPGRRKITTRKITDPAPASVTPFRF